MAVFDGQPARLWSGAGDGFQVRLFRKTFDLKTLPWRAVLEVFAEQRYHVWINGVYLGRGPCFHHPDQFPVDAYDASLTVGRNVIAVLVHSAGHSMHNRVYSGEPGLITQFTLEHASGVHEKIVSDDTWRVTDRTGWRTKTPRRSWAIDSVEQFEQANAPANWQAIDFADTHWHTPQAIRPATQIDGATFLARPVPNLTSEDVYPTAVLGTYRIEAAPITDEQLKSSGDLGRSIMQAEWTKSASVPPTRDFVIDGRGELICLDFGRERVGRYIIECDCPSAGVIDIGWSEVAYDGRPQVVRKGVGYVDRIFASGGTLRFEPIQFNAFRYLLAAFRGFSGPVKVRKLFVRATEPDLQWPEGFSSSDEKLNAIFKMCVLSHRVGTQEAIMDCPSREQAAYVGDGMPVGRWITQLTGDDRHWKYLVREQFRRQSPQGLLKSSIFSASEDTLIDYTLLAVVGTRDYLQYSGDVEIVRDLIDGCRKAVGFFDEYRKGDSPLCDWHLGTPMGREWEPVYNPTRPSFDKLESMNLFIDHPGLGWHNPHDAGIDRRGTNAALNGFYVMAKRALADLEEATGERTAASRLRKEADAIAKALHETFYDPSRKLFVDGVFEGKQLAQVSEQTNTLAVAAGCLPDDAARDLLERLLNSNDPTIARNGPYFWTYLFPEMTRLGLTPLALSKARQFWGRMIDGGASALWETFAGDDLDSWCHPWSAAIQAFLQTTILGLPSVEFDPQAVTLRPRTDLLPQARGGVFTRSGRFEIEWQRDGDQLILAGAVPEGLRATLENSTGTPIQSVSGRFSVSIPSR